jgi:hypothetical protein
MGQVDQDGGEEGKGGAPTSSPTPLDPKMIDPRMTSDRLDTIHRLIAARAPELSDADLALLAAGSDNTLPVAIAEQVMVVLDQMEARMTELEERRPSW